MKTYYSVLLSANLSLPYLIITCVSYWYSPRGGILQPTVLHQVLLVNQCGSQIREPQELTPSNHIHRRSLTYYTRNANTRKAIVQLKLCA
jgi:hypothetical protein